MDKNKLKVLQDIDYKVQRTCGNCDWFVGDSYTKSIMFSTCSKHTYEHKKHIGPERKLSVHRDGVCDKHEWNGNALNFMHSYSQFT